MVMVKVVLLGISVCMAFIFLQTTTASAGQHMCDIPHKWVGKYGEGHLLFHDWYKTLSDISGRNCCNGGECRPTQAEYRQDGWYAKVDDVWTKMPDNTLIPTDSPDLGAHVCAIGEHVYCFVPGKTGSERTYPGAWLARAMLHGPILFPLRDFTQSIHCAAEDISKLLYVNYTRMKNEINLYTITIVPMMRALENLSGILDKAGAHSDAKKTDWMNFESALLDARIVFDQFPFLRQVQVACDNAKGAAARLSGAEPPKMEDNEKTIAELKVRIDKTLEYVKTVKSESIIGKENEMINMPVYFGGKKLIGYDYAVYYAMPNFYFHMATAYSILRMNGVTIGKDDFLGALDLK